MRPIDADELIHDFEVETHIHLPGELWHITGIKAFIENAPTVDAVELPLKVGHIVYHQFERWERKVDIRPFQVTSVSISQNKKGEWKKRFRISWLDGDKTRDPWYDYSFDDVGKTVFFTREEAEKAWEAILAERRSDEDTEVH